MLNENRVKIMTKMAMYESNEGAEDLKINAYYKRDYVSYRTLISILWMTVGYLMIVGVGACLFIEQIIEKMDLDFLVMVAVSVLAVYFILLLIYLIGGTSFYQKKYSAARQRLKKFNQRLTKLNKMYEKENE